MSLHPSLKVDKAGSTQRTVLTRIERIKDLMKKGSWSETSSVNGLPKNKVVRVKAKKKTKEEAAAGTEAAAGAAGAAAKPGAKPAGDKAAPAKK